MAPGGQKSTKSGWCCARASGQRLGVVVVDEVQRTVRGGDDQESRQHPAF